jgi:hypothetical protein
MTRLRAGTANRYAVNVPVGNRPAALLMSVALPAVFALGAAGSSVRSSTLLLHLDGLRGT